MMQFSLPVFLLMSGAAVLGFLIAWIWIRNRIDTMQTTIVQHQEQFLKLQAKHHELLEHSNSRQGEKEKLIQKIDDQQLKLAQRKVQNKQLTEDQAFFAKELKTLRAKKNKNLTLPRQITGEIASLRSQIDELTQEKENWREKYMIIRDANDEHLAKLSAISKDSEIPEEETSEKETPNAPEKIDWREEFHQMQLELNKKLQANTDASRRLQSEYDEMKEHYSEKLSSYAKDNETLNQELAHLRQQKNSDPAE